MTRGRTLCAIALLAAACDGFDPALYQRALSRERSDSCRESDVPLLTSSAEFISVDLAEFDDNWQAANCTDARAPGHDAFFAIDLAEGEQAHFHVNAIDAIDPVLYVVDGCDERACQPLHAASSCPGAKEHLSFIAPRTARYFIGVDAAEPGGGRVELLALVPTCGDGEKQHSEACDDGNEQSGDGCDARCRLELPASERMAQEPNDDLAFGNVVALAPAPSLFHVRGTLEGPCDPEVFSFAVPAGAMLSVRVLGAGGAPCPALVPGAELDLQLFEGLTSIAVGTPEDDPACVGLGPLALRAAPEPGAAPASPTTYHVRLASRPPLESPPVDFTLELELQPTAPEAL